MNRRQALPVIGALPLALVGCGDDANTVTRRFRVIATVEVDGQKVEGSTVMEITYRKLTKSLIGAGASTKLYGEALILDLKGKGTVFLPPITYYYNENVKQKLYSGNIKANLYESGVLSSLGIEGDIGLLNAERLDVIRRARGRLRFSLSDYNRPTLLPIAIAFLDERRPQSIYELDLRQIGDSFPGVKFVNLEIEFTDAPITKTLEKRLPWLRHGGKTLFPRDPPGTNRRARDQPIGYKILESSFFGDGSR